MSKIIALIIIVGLIIFFLSQKRSNKTIPIQIDNKTFNLGIANNPLSRSRGLSKRKSLCQNCGMIFVYQKESVYPFWMKNTNFPLDILWLDKTGQVVDIKQGQPQSLDILKNSTPAQYIIELPTGSTTLNIGDIISLPHEIN